MGEDKLGPGKARFDYPPGTKIKGPRNQLWRLEAAAHLRVWLLSFSLPSTPALWRLILSAVTLEISNK